jgi:hypothetical protein
VKLAAGSVDPVGMAKNLVIARLDAPWKMMSMSVMSLQLVPAGKALRGKSTVYGTGSLRNWLLTVPTARLHWDA